MEQKVKNRSEIAEAYKWDLTQIIASKEDFEKKIKVAKEEMANIDSYQNKVCESSQSLLETLQHKFSLSSQLERLYAYGELHLDTDFSDKEFQRIANEAKTLIYEEDAKESFIVPEILAAGQEKITEFIKENKELEPYQFFLEQIFREKEHILDTEKEEILSQFSSVTNYFKESFTYARNKEMSYGTITDSEGNEVELLPSNFDKYVVDKDRRVRKEAVLARNEAYEEREDSIGANYIGHIKADEVESKMRHYNSTLEADLKSLNIPRKVYDTLIKKGKEAISIYQKYLKIRQKVLKVDTLESWDLHVPLTADTEKEFTYEEAKQILLDAFQIYGDEYISILKEAFDKRWIDVYPNKNKKVGWYSTCVYDAHPVVFANFENHLNDISALAHECGHMVHFAFSKNNQPYQYYDCSLFEAEVASLTNEILLSRYLLNKSHDKNEKLSLLANIIGVFEGNFFGAIEGALFEEIAHDKVRNGESLTTESLNNTWKNIQEEFVGDIVKLSSYNGWCRVPHFYISFYYFKYATGVTAAFYQAKNILENKEKAISPYLEFLKVGGSKYPIDSLKVAGIDMTREEVFEEALQLFDSLLDEFMEIYNS